MTSETMTLESMRDLCNAVIERLALLALFPLLCLASCFSAWRYLWSIITNPDKAFVIATMIDETANAGANGRENETISARAAKASAAGKTWGCLLCWILGKIRPHHCETALKNDITAA